MWLCYQAVCMPRWQADRDDDMMDPSKSPEGANHYCMRVARNYYTPMQTTSILLFNTMYSDKHFRWYISERPGCLGIY
jgi:hypothetical protein